jgi:hypothetical protein
MVDESRTGLLTRQPGTVKLKEVSPLPSTQGGFAMIERLLGVLLALGELFFMLLGLVLAIPDYLRVRRLQRM